MMPMTIAATSPAAVQPRGKAVLLNAMLVGLLAFLTVVDARRLDLIELGPSGGLNLYWDRYAYRYGEEQWGDRSAGLVLSGRAEGGPPPDLLRATKKDAAQHQAAHSFGMRLGIRERERAAPRTAKHEPLIHAELCANRFDVLDQVPGRVVFE